MKLEQQVASLDLSKKLKELGVLQGGAFDYYENTLHPEQPFIVLRPTVNVMESSPNWICSAFTVAELGEMLPPTIPIMHKATIPHLVIGRLENSGFWYCDYHYYYPFPEQPAYEPCVQFKADTEANARAKMLIYLIEKGIVKP